MDNNLIMKEIDERLINNIGGLMGKELSEVIKCVISYIDDISEATAENKSDIKLINHNIKNIMEVSQDTSNSIEKISRKIDTLENDDTNKFNIYKTQAKSRVFQLVGDSSSCRFILFYNSFVAKLHSYVANTLSVANTKKIYVDDFSKAVELARSWYPDTKYIRDKINDVLKISTKNKLTDSQQKKVNALNELLNEVGGDINAIRF